MSPKPDPKLGTRNNYSSPNEADASNQSPAVSKCFEVPDVGFEMSSEHEEPNFKGYSVESMVLVWDPTTTKSVNVSV
jgi:hypothetical protein